MTDSSNAQNQLKDRSPTMVALDNLIRRKLRVSDPTDPEEISRALRSYYRVDTEAMEREAAGLPFLLAPLPKAVAVAAASSQAEVEQAITDVERDLTTLKTNSLLKDIEPELRGWESAIRAAVADGVNAARQALDPRQRDLAFANRRLLGDYARVARFVGALTPNMNIYYRRLAQSLDEVAAMLLVLMGEALANIGFAGGRFLLQVTASELQQRRDAVIYALRNLIGSTQEAHGPQEWPRGLVAYRQFLERLEASGMSDLKVLFQENSLARIMDDLIHRAAGGSAEELRALGATAQLSVESLQRLCLFGQRLVDPESPPLTAFLSAVQLFLDAFTNAASGYRLLFIARPPMVYYGLYGIGGPDDASRLLLELVIKRGYLAEMLDCYMGCKCDKDSAGCQILLDKILYELDRAIDFYAQGTDPEANGEPEHRAAAYGYLVQAVLLDNEKAEGQWPESQLKNERPKGKCFPFAYSQGKPPTGDRTDDGHPCSKRSMKRDHALFCLLEDIQDELWHVTFTLNKVTLTGSPDGPSKEFMGFTGEPWLKLCKEVERLHKEIDSWIVTNNFDRKYVESQYPSELTDSIKMCQNWPEIRKQVRDELCSQELGEQRWENLLHTMAPSCIRFNGVLDVTQDVIKEARKMLELPADESECPKFDPSIPPALETSVASLAYRRRSEGG